MIDLNNPIKSPYGKYISMISHIFVDCESQTIEVRYIETFDKLKGNGKKIWGGKNPNPVWEKPTEGSVDFYVNKLLCSNY